MNKRNLQIFGISKKTKLIFFAVILLMVLTASFFFLKRDSASTVFSTEEPSQEGKSVPVAGAAVADIPTFTQEEQLIPQNVVEQQEPSPEAETPQTYLEYEGNCAADIKQAEDDVSDINSYLPEDESALADTKASYEQKKTDLEAQIADLESQIESLKTDLQTTMINSESQITMFEEKVALSKSNLEAAQKKLDELRNSCKKDEA